MGVFEQGFPVPVPDGGGLPAQVKDSVLRDFYALEDLEYGDLVCCPVNNNLISTMGNSNQVTVVLLDETRGIVLYSPSGNAKAKAFTVGFTGVTFGGEVAGSYEASTFFGGCFVSETKFIQSDAGGAVVYTINWSTRSITVGTRLTFTPGSLSSWVASFVNTLVPGTESVIVIGSAYAVVLTVSGTTLIQGTRITLTYSNVGAAVEVSPNVYFVGTSQLSSQNYWILSVSGTVIGQGNVYTSGGYRGDVSLVFSSKYVLAFEQGYSAPNALTNVYVFNPFTNTPTIVNTISVPAISLSGLYMIGCRAVRLSGNRAILHCVFGGSSSTYSLADIEISFDDECTAITVVSFRIYGSSSQSYGISVRGVTYAATRYINNSACYLMTKGGSVVKAISSKYPFGGASTITDSIDGVVLVPAKAGGIAKVRFFGLST